MQATQKQFREVPENLAPKIEAGLLRIEAEVRSSAAFSDAPFSYLAYRVLGPEHMLVWKVYDLYAEQLRPLSERLLIETIPALVFSTLRKRGWIGEYFIRLGGGGIRTLDHNAFPDKLIPADELTESLGGITVPAGFTGQFKKQMEPRILYWRAEMLEHGKAAETDEQRAQRRRTFVKPMLATKGWSILDWSTHSDLDYNTAKAYYDGRERQTANTRMKLAKSLDVPVSKFPQ